MTHDACTTADDYSNRKHALTVGRITAVLCVCILGYGYWTAWSRDRICNAEMLAMTDQQRAEQAILDTLQFGRVLVDADGIIVSANAAFKKWTHWPNCVGKHVYDIMPEPVRLAHTTAFDLAITKAKWSSTPIKPKLIDCKLPRIDDPTKVTHVTIAVSVIKHKEEDSPPYVIAYLWKTRALQRISAMQ